MASLLDLDTLQQKVENALQGCTLSDEAKSRVAAVFDDARAAKDEPPESMKPAADRMRAAVGIKPVEEKAPLGKR